MPFFENSYVIVYLFFACYFMYMRLLIVCLLFSCFLISSCDEGLSPDLADVRPGFGGTVTFSGDWNPEINQTHVVVFRDPLLSIEDFNVFNLSFVSEAIPNGSLSYSYSTLDTTALISTVEPGEISYIAVAQSLTDTITLRRENWIVVGLYFAENDSTQPGSIDVDEGEFINNINIHCDFNNPPPQPPGGE
jgi:hypothetical protein